MEKRAVVRRRCHTWELIVRYNGSLRFIEEELGGTYVILNNGYAIVTMEECKIDQLASFPENEFIESNIVFFMR
ncbi:hypothetical protein [Anaerocolumna jejuensis]|uniref:hypothetical protein n=1 Tax=Anaerocolumna jejuensis TaxID=259063 RepID=UPI003F7C1798